MKPWEQYQSANAAGPWTKYQPQETALDRMKRSDPGEYDPESPEYQAKYGASSGGKLENFAAGAGKAIVDMGRGVKQLGAKVGNKVGLVSDETVSGIQRDIDDSSERDQALMKTGAGLTGNIAGNVATIAIPASGVARGAQAVNMGRTANAARTLVNPASYKAAAATGALYGTAAPVETGGSRLQNAAAGTLASAGGQGLAKGVGRLAQPLAKAGGAAVDKLKAAGVPLDLAQRSGNTTLQRLKSGLNANPLTAGGQRKAGEAQQRGFTRAALKTIGADADNATTDVMSKARADIGEMYDDIAARNPVDFDNELQSGIARLVKEANKELNDQQMKVLGRNIDDVLDKAGSGRIDGKAFQNIKKTLDRVSKSPDSSLGYYARGLRDELLEALKRSSSDADKELLKTANKQWANLKTIEGAIDKGGEGLISPLRVSSTLGTKANRWRSVYGGGDQELVELAQAGRNVLPEKLPDSGTAGRLMAGGLLTGGGVVGANASPENADKIALAAALMYGGPKAVQTLLNRAPNKGRYLADGLKNPTLRKLLETPATSALPGNAALAAALSQSSASR